MFFCVAIFLLLKRLFINSLVTKRSAFWAGCKVAPSSSFWKPSPCSPTAKLTSPKNFPRRQGWSLPSKRAFDGLKKDVELRFRLNDYLHLRMSIPIGCRGEFVPQTRIGLNEISRIRLRPQTKFVQHFPREDLRQELTVYNALVFCIDNFSAFLCNYLFSNECATLWVILEKMQRDL